VARGRAGSERFSDPGPSSTSRFATGCGVALVALVLLVGAIGIVVGARRRLAGWGGGDEEVAGPDEPDPVGAGDPGSAGPVPGDPAVPDPRDAMRQRYRPGPFVQVQSMVPSGRLLPSLGATSLPVGRTVDSPWIVPGAELLPGPIPGASPGGPTVWHDPGEPAGRPLAVLARTPARALVRARDAAGGTDVMSYVVDFVGYPGHFVLPATVPTELGVVQAGGSDGATVQFAILTPLMPNGATVTGGQSFPVTLRIGAVDSNGRVSPLVTRELSVVAVGSGDVEVTLTMGEATDLDLYVTDPAGVTIFYANTRSVSGGHLDLDANAACSANVGVDNEHIFWPSGGAPVGTYRVNVAHYQSCIQGRPVDYRVTVSACGETVVLSGRFEGGARSERCMSAGPGDRSWCQNVVTFDVPPCPGSP
jgi:hypothetical protein